MASEEYFESILRSYIISVTDIDCTDKTIEEILQIARSHDIDTHHLKRLSNPRIQKAVGIIEGLWPKNILDIGSGKGFLIWHLIERIKHIRVKSIDILPDRIKRIQSTADASGLPVTTYRYNGEALPFPDDNFDVVSMLEVMEHTPEPAKMASEACRVSREWIVASVPSKPDDNPEHIHLFDRDTMNDIFKSAGAVSVRIEQDNSHFYILARVDHG